ncbi:hypothetical protein [Massilia sp. 9I]|uniref:hypothetical protein n=1 Tax=Massilia sp. 9I TaxID=2653152 RepID=UPI0012F3B6CB|nr:hypothetical protein [Massilia sp. 9I]VXC34251.1 conserved hypothetical protein [Massilia sp. 9I]
MVTSIGSATLAPTTQAQAAKPRPEDTTVPAQAVASDSAATENGAETQSALSSATARVGDELQAQADASRVQRAIEEAPPAPEGAESGTEDTEDTVTASAAPARGAAPAGGGGAAATSETTSADYIAEADTNSDKKVSDQERIAYEKKLEQQSESKAANRDQSSELNAAYGLSEEAAPTLAVTA